MKFKTHSCKIPTWALNYLVNADAEGLTDEDLALVRAWESKWDGPISISTSGDPYFSNCPEFELLCDVEDCEVLAQREG